VVVIDPSAPYASGIRAALPDAQIAVDHWHLVRLGNDMVTEVRQRVAREQLGRRGRISGHRVRWTTPTSSPSKVPSPSFTQSSHVGNSPAVDHYQSHAPMLSRPHTLGDVLTRLLPAR